jgi:DNA-directed RNA polymerase subunit N (RpoN/RPB10)
MLTPLVCLSCKWPIGDIAPVFWAVHAARARKALKKGKTVPPKAAENLALTSDNTDLFEALGIKADCCRMCLETSMQLKNHY